MTADHVRVLLDNDTDGAAFGHVATLLARSRVPAEILQAIRCGRVSALQKPDGGVRGIVVGDTLRRMVARTMAQQFSAQVELATSPHQYALKTKAGCETVAHILQVLTELDEEATVSVDGIGAFDFISRNAMMSGLRFMVGGDRVLPFVRAFYREPSSYLWEDDVGEVHPIPQGEGGEQGDPLMPLLFCLGQHSALSAVVAGLWEGERLFAYLDELYVVCKPDRVGAVHDLRVHLWDKCRMQARPRCGTKVAPIHPIAPDCSARQRTSLQRQRCGEGTPSCTLINRDSRCLEFLLDIQCTSTAFLR